jgi:hypothetical protein
MAEPVARATMLIRRPRAEVFHAFVQPRLVTRFWLKSTTGPLAAGARVEWEFQLEQVVGATEGFTIVLCDLKTLLETGRSANLVRDKAELIHRAQSGSASAAS